MLEQTNDFNKDDPSTWKEKKEAMQRLANALKNTSPPLINKNANSPPPALRLRSCKWLRKLKTMFWGAYKNL
ncbi:MAG: hypothetical protein EOM83_08810 [Clostridia bacterium]|nr:hypothetical protein [Clostridia bacterium]